MATRLGVVRDDTRKRTLEQCNFTTFVLPFRYELQRRYLGGRGLHYRRETQSKADWIQRQRFQYLTGETREVMFSERERAGVRLFSELDTETLWLELPDAARLSWYTKQGLPPFDLQVRARLVLFDERTARAHRSRSRCCGCIGFLLLTVSMVNGMSFADMLDFNEKFRLIRYQYARQKPDLEGRLPPEVSSGDTRAGTERRYPGFTLRFPGDTAAPHRSRMPDGWLDFWAEFLCYPVVVDGQTFRLEFDLTTYPDERAFVVSHACVEDISWETDRNSRLWVLWHQFLHVEPEETRFAGGIVPYEDAWLRARTYFRWGQHPKHARLYGFSNYSCCALCLPHAFAPALDHFGSMYLDQLLLILYQRAAVMAFGRELSGLTQRWKVHRWSGARAGLRELREAFDQFINLYWFPVFTNQVQGLEMYEIARQELDNLTLFEELRTEMAGTWGFMEARVAEQLTRGGAVVAMFTMALAYLGVGLLQPTAAGDGLRVVWPSLPIVLGLGAFLTFVLASIYFWAIGSRSRTVWVLVPAAFLTLCAWYPWVLSAGDLVVRWLWHHFAVPP
jgi:hypothetical protein